MSGVADLARSPKTKRLVKLGGRILVVLSLVLLAREAARHWTALASWRPDGGQITAVLAVSLFYGLSIFINAENWHRIIRIFGDEPRRRTYRSYTMTQIAKYLPGNVAHLFGRAFYLRGGALSNKQLGIATLIEIVVLPFGAGIFVILACLSVPVTDLLPAAGGLQPFVGPISVVLGAAAIAVFFLPRENRFSQTARSLVVTTVFALIFMSILGLCFAATLNSIAVAPPLLAAVVAVLGWIVGYFTPGAPGGLGTREALMLLLLDGAVPQAEALIAIAAFRLVTVFGDIICFVAGWVLIRNGETGSDAATS